jgi:tRNA A-37 threonylcarbamoyl transferase component Bud32
MSSDGQLKAGDILDGRYEVLSILGQGGYGVVYAARQLATGQQVAVKLLLTERLTLIADVATHEARFQRETQLIANLKHPNIVRLIDSGRLATGQLFTVLELVEGQPLSALIDQLGPLPVRTTLRLMTQVLEALNHAHTRGVIHRDLKPQNIMVSGDLGARPNAMVLDFGIATLTGSTALAGVDPRSLTQTGQLHGTPAYMAPEQLQGEATPGSDLYAWGLVLLECLTGKSAVKGTSLAEVIYYQLSAEGPALPAALKGTALFALLARATEKDARRRYGTATEALGDLERAGAQVLPERLESLETGYGGPLTATLDEMEIVTPQQARRHSGDGGSHLTQEGEGRGERGDRRGADTTLKHLPSQGMGRWLVWGALAAVVAVGLIGAFWFGTARRAQPTADATPAAAALQTLCPSGQQLTRKTNGQCCWPGQSSNGVGSPCVGVPSECPVGYTLDASSETCALLPCHGGRARMPDGLHCCWQGQAWDTDQAACVGANITCDLSQGYYADQQRCFWLGPEALALHTACAPPSGEPAWRACAALGERLFIGEGAEPNPERGASLIDGACAEAGDHDACALTAALIQRGALSAPRGTAYNILKDLCDESHPRACHALAAAAFAGDDTPAGEGKGEEVACRALSDACTLRDLLSCDQLGLAQLPDSVCAPPPPAAGAAGPADVQGAANLFAHACARGQGWPPGCTHLGDLLAGLLTAAPHGLDAAAYPTPQALWLQACDRGEPLACARLLRAPPPDTSPDVTARWRALACARRMAPCQATP